ncbi:hypothetical protein HYFRA_00012414 [Hymenoscyphus fraxineus]|uniref:Uncharacterized protein n=1 Tax=Hymenoscyphus fraxineus TaxID=746836 RepID=A0A9N9L4T6_9HELO|nr:hypothetical protein HYFRA_00012414 [Hymenoscyphus fraxineus]
MSKEKQPTKKPNAPKKPQKANILPTTQKTKSDSRHVNITSHIISHKSKHRDPTHDLRLPSSNQLFRGDLHPFKKGPHHRALPGRRSLPVSQFAEDFMNLRLVNRMIYLEGSRLFYTGNTFCVGNGDWGSNISPPSTFKP